MLCEPLAGIMADKFGAPKIMIAGICGILCFAFLHKMIIISGETKSIYFAQCLFGFFLAMYMAITPGFLCSLLPTHNRCRILGIGYNIPLMIFGGTTPIIILYLNQINHYLSTSYLACSCLLALLGLYILVNHKETRG